MLTLRRFFGWMWAFTLIELLVVVAIVAILASLLLPALTAARERARRTACSNNLRQFSMGLETYIGMYGDYFPTWAEGGAPLFEHANWSNQTWVRPGDPGRVETSGYFSTGVVRGMNSDGSWREVYSVLPPSSTESESLPTDSIFGIPPFNYRSIFTGATSYSGPGPAPEGDFNLAPSGLGYLLTGNHIPDGRLYLCPSATERPHFIDSQNVGGHTISYAHTGRDFRRAGGFAPADFTHGDWNWLGPVNTNSRHPKHRAVLSHYSYRLAPMTPPSGNAANSLNWRGTSLRLLYTRPDRIVTPGEPAFKNSRQLGGRAILSDSFDRDPETLIEPGAAYYTHKDGYNVLYGDWSVRWYGDAEERIQWAQPYVTWLGSDVPIPQATTGFLYRRPWYSLSSSVIAEYEAVEGITHINHRPRHIDPNPRVKYSGLSSGMRIWHQFDVANGIDVGVDW